MESGGGKVQGGVVQLLEGGTTVLCVKARSWRGAQPVLIDGGVMPLPPLARINSTGEGFSAMPRPAAAAMPP